MPTTAVSGSNINFEAVTDSPKWLFPVLIGGGVIIALAVIWAFVKRGK